MRSMKEPTRAKLMMLHGLTMMMLGMLLFHVRDMMGTLYAFGCAFAMLLVTGSLILLAVFDWICVAGQSGGHALKLGGLLLVSAGLPRPAWSCLRTRSDNSDVQLLHRLIRPVTRRWNIQI
jgi:hypothetical protein